MKLLSSHGQIRLYETWPDRDTFRFKRSLVERDEIEATGIRRAITLFDVVVGN